jgi:2-polyprenyl-6-methoxyphenol hydroxylase-like FAD-dependent oxidoreductase
VLLGDYGADIIKVEAPTGDTARQVTPLKHEGMGYSYLTKNRNKRSIVLDLKQAEHHAALEKLLETADIFVYSARPQAMARRGLTPTRFAELNPGLISVSLVGYGEGGPYTGRPAYEDLIQGLTSVPSLLTRAGSPQPQYVPLSFNDRGVGIYAAALMMIALHHRDRTGEGQHLEVPMFETMAQLVVGDHAGGMAWIPPIAPPGYLRTLTPERRPYQTKDGFICVIVYTDSQWRAFGTLIGRPVLIVGGGPVGLTLALDLAIRGIRSTLVERDPGTAVELLAKAGTLNERTMEYCRWLGISDAIANVGFPDDHPRDTVYCTALNGFVLGRDYRPSAKDRAPAPESPEILRKCPQFLFDPLLAKAVQERGMTQILYGTIWVSGTQDADGVTSTLAPGAPGADGRASMVRSKYLVGCDGAGSAIRRAAGIGFDGKQLDYSISAMIEVEHLEDYHPLGRAERLDVEAIMRRIIGNDRGRWKVCRVMPLAAQPIHGRAFHRGPDPTGGRRRPHDVADRRARAQRRTTAPGCRPWAGILCLTTPRRVRPSGAPSGTR